MAETVFGQHSWIIVAMTFIVVIAIGLCLKAALSTRVILAECLLAMVLWFVLLCFPKFLPENAAFFDEMWRVMAVGGVLLGTVVVSAAVHSGRDSVWDVTIAGLLGGAAGGISVAIVVMILGAISDPVDFVAARLGFVLVVLFIGLLVGLVSGSLSGAIWGYAYTAGRGMSARQASRKGTQIGK